MATKAELEQSNAELVRQLEDAKREMESFKKQVKVKATELAEEHDWCEVVDRALDELGIATKQLVKVTYKMTEWFTVDKEAWEKNKSASQRDFRNSLTWDVEIDYSNGGTISVFTEVNHDDWDFSEGSGDRQVEFVFEEVAR